MLPTKCKIATTLLVLGFFVTLGGALPQFLAESPKKPEPPPADANTKGAASKLTPVMVQDFEKPASPPNGVGRQHPQRERLGPVVDRSPARRRSSA